MQKIRFQKMLCLGILGQNNLFKEFLPVEELRKYFEQAYQRQSGSVLFLNKCGKPAFIKFSDLNPSEKEYFGL